MAETFPQILTANRLKDGAVVYMDEKGGWVEELRTSALWHDAENAAKALAQAQASIEARLIVDPYLIEIEESQSGWVPQTMRERIRASRNPTITVNVGSWNQSHRPGE